MEQESSDILQTCSLCQSLCHAVHCPEGHSYLRPMVKGLTNSDQARAQILTMLAEARFCHSRLKLATVMLEHIAVFLEGKAHKIMALEVRRTLKELTEPRVSDPV